MSLRKELPPAWCFNLQSRPEAEVEVGKRCLRVSAHVAEGTEAARLLPLAHTYNPHWAGYQKNCVRRIPLLVLSPAASA